MEEHRGAKSSLASSLATGDPDLNALIVAGQHRARVRRLQGLAIVVAAVALLAWLVVQVMPQIIAPSSVQVCGSTFTGPGTLFPQDRASGMDRLGTAKGLGVVPMPILGHCSVTGTGTATGTVYVQVNQHQVAWYTDVNFG